MICSIENCSEPIFSKCNGERGGKLYSGPLCKRHYSKLYRHGDPNVGRAKRKDAGLPRKRVGGEKYNHGDGYVKVWLPEHPNANKYGYVKEHTLVMSQKLCRPLREGESVHHLNGVRSDNHPDNLELWVKPQRNGVRFQDAILDSIKFLESYGYKVCIPFEQPDKELVSSLTETEWVQLHYLTSKLIMSKKCFSKAMYEEDGSTWCLTLFKQ